MKSLRTRSVVGVTLAAMTIIGASCTTPALQLPYPVAVTTPISPPYSGQTRLELAPALNRLVLPSEAPADISTLYGCAPSGGELWIELDWRWPRPTTHAFTSRVHDIVDWSATMIDGLWSINADPLDYGPPFPHDRVVAEVEGTYDEAPWSGNIGSIAPGACFTVLVRSHYRGPEPFFTEHASYEALTHHLNFTLNW